MLHTNVPAVKQEGDGRKSDNSSDSGSTGDEERLRRLFQACDQDGDGFIDSDDLLNVCQQLNMEDAVDEIMQELRPDQQGRISFQEFAQCRMRVVPDIEEDSLRVPPRTQRQAMLPTQVTAWRSGSENSLGAMSQPPESLDYDSGARDCSPEPTTLQKLIETHDPYILQHLMESSRNRYTTQNFVDLANTLHLSTMSSLKGEIMELSKKLQHVKSERDHLEKQLSKIQSDKLHLQRECEDRLEEQSLRYEERITELHSVIAELRRKLDRHQINVIREEEEEFDSDTGKSIKDDLSANENNANESQSASVADMVLGSDLNAELSRVVSELESAIDERKKIAVGTSGAEEEAENGIDSVEQQAIEVCKEVEDFHLSSPPPYVDVSQLEEEIRMLRAESVSYQERLGRQETELNKMRAQLGSMREDRDKMKRRFREMQRAHSFEVTSPTSPQHSRTSTPTKNHATHINPSTGERSGTSVVSSQSGSYELPSTPVHIAKIAELKKLKTSSSSERQVLGAEISSMGLPNTKVAEHLAQSLQECSNLQEIVQTVYKCGNEMSEGKVREFEIETERLTSRIDHLKSQNDVLNLTLEESKAHADRLSVLMGKYESNNTALQLAINYSDQALEAFEVLLTLVESDQGVLLANCRAAGLGSVAGDSYYADEQQEITTILQKAHSSRKTSENIARQLLHKLDRSCGMHHIPGCTVNPWEDLSSSNTGSTGRTTSTTSSTASDTEFGKVDEQRLRDYIQQLKNDRAAVKLTVLELESVHIDPLPQDMSSTFDSQRLDLENAVLMQELMAMKEEKAELRAQNYLMEKEKKALELRINGKESQEQAYLVQIEHLKSEVKEQNQTVYRKPDIYKKSTDSDSSSLTPSITLAELRTSNSSDIAQDLSESLKREKMLKTRVTELMSTLEKLSRNSEVRHQQSAEFVNDLKRANSALISAFEKAKKRYQAKVKKLEMQIKSISDRYEVQARSFKQRIASLEEELARPVTNETSL